MKYIIERILNNKRTFYGTFLIRIYAEREMKILMESDISGAEYHIHQLLPPAQLQKPI
jgi:hypothetical protein